MPAGDAVGLGLGLGSGSGSGLGLGLGLGLTRVSSKPAWGFVLLVWGSSPAWRTAVTLELLAAEAAVEAVGLSISSSSSSSE